MMSSSSCRIRTGCVEVEISGPPIVGTSALGLDRGSFAAAVVATSRAGLAAGVMGVCEFAWPPGWEWRVANRRTATRSAAAPAVNALSMEGENGGGGGPGSMGDDGRGKGRGL